MNLFLLMEWRDTSFGLEFYLRGISNSLEEAISLLAQHKLAGVGQNDVNQDCQFDSKKWQIEEVPSGVMLRNDIPEHEEYANAGAIAMYDIDGSLIRKLSDE